MTGMRTNQIEGKEIGTIHLVVKGRPVPKSRPPLQGHVAVFIRIYSMGRFDLDNVAKSILDGMNQICYRDDIGLDEIKSWIECDNCYSTVEVMKITIGNKRQARSFFLCNECLKDLYSLLGEVVEALNTSP